jgi:hypothetical protein
MNQANNRAQNRNRIGKKHQDQTADGSIKGLLADNLVHVSLREADVEKSSLRDACFCSRNRDSVPLNAYDFPRGADYPSYQHRYIAYTGAEIEDPLAGTNASLAE